MRWILLLLIPALLLAGDNQGSQVIQTYKQAIETWIPIFKNAGYFLFGTFALIALVLEFGFKATQGDIDLGSVLGALIRNILIFGIFKAFIDMNFLGIIFDSFKQLGGMANAASGVSTPVSADTLLDIAYELMGALKDKTSWFHVSASIGIMIIGVIAVLAIIWMGVLLVMVYVKFLVMWGVSPLFLALGVLPQTRSWAMGAITSTISAAFEYMLIKLIMGLSIATIKTYGAKAVQEDGSLFTLLIVALVAIGLSQMVNSIASGMFSGTGTGTSASGFQMARSAAMGAVAGLVGGGLAAASREAAKSSSSGPEGSGGAAGGSSPGGGGGSAAAGAAAASGAATPSGAGGQQGGSNSGGGWKQAAFTGMKIAAGAAAGAVSGAVKGAAGLSTQEAGKKSARATVAAMNGVAAGAKWLNEKRKGDGTNKDRHGFDTSLVKGKGQNHA